MDGLNDDDPYYGDQPGFRPEIYSDHLLDALRYNLVMLWGEDPKNPRRLKVTKRLSRVHRLRRAIFVRIWERYTQHGLDHEFIVDFGDGPFRNDEDSTYTWVDNPNYVPPIPEVGDTITIQVKGKDHGTDSKDANGSQGSLRQDGVPEL